MSTNALLETTKWTASAPVQCRGVPLGLTLVAIVLLLGVAPCGATPITWALVNVNFDDGGTASGSFVYDADTNTYSSINVITTGGTTLPGGTYDSLAPSYTPTNGFVALVLSTNGPDFTGDLTLDLDFIPPLTNAGGVAPLFFTFSWERTCNDAGCTSPAAPLRNLTSGSVAAIPEPAPLSLIVVPVVVMLAVRRSRQRNTPQATS